MKKRLFILSMFLLIQNATQMAAQTTLPLTPKHQISENKLQAWNYIKSQWGCITGKVKCSKRKKRLLRAALASIIAATIAKAGSKIKAQIEAQTLIEAKESLETAYGNYNTITKELTEGSHFITINEDISEIYNKANGDDRYWVINAYAAAIDAFNAGRYYYVRTNLRNNSYKDEVLDRLILKLVNSMAKVFPELKGLFEHLNTENFREKIEQVQLPNSTYPAVNALAWVLYKHFDFNKETQWSTLIQELKNIADLYHNE